MATVGFISFGGGSAVIPVIEDQIVTKRRLIEDDDFMRQTIVANITPGAQPPKMATFAASHLAGARVAVAGALLIALPGVLISVLLVALSARLGDAAIAAVSYASVGINAFIIVLLVSFITKIMRKAGSHLITYLVIMVATTLAGNAAGLVKAVGLLLGQNWSVSLPKLSAVQIMAIALASITVYSVTHKPEESATQTMAPVTSFRSHLRIAGGFVIITAIGAATLMALLGRQGLHAAGLLGFSTLSSFGGGAAYIAVADGFFVGSGLVDPDTFYTLLVPVANAAPGPVLVKLASIISFELGQQVGPVQAWLAAAAALFIVVGACCAVGVLVYGAYDRLKNNRIFVSIATYVLPVICGLLVSTALTMAKVSAGIAEGAGYSPMLTMWLTVGVVTLMYVVYSRKLLPELAMLGLGGAASLAWLML